MSRELDPNAVRRRLAAEAIDRMDRECKARAEAAMLPLAAVTAPTPSEPARAKSAPPKGKPRTAKGKKATRGRK